MTAAKDTLLSNMSKFQIGTKPGHRPQEHLFTLKSVINFYMSMDKPLILSTFDVSKFFDRENLRDVMNELHKNGLRGKYYRLIYELNKNTCIRVKTPVGISQSQSTGETVGQGTVEGAIMSAISLDNGVCEFFANSEKEVTYPRVALGPFLFQDDVCRLASDVASAQYGNDMMECVAETKLLDYNLEKSCFLTIGKKKRRLEVKKQLVDTPLKLCGRNMVHETEFKYLGDFISELGITESVYLTVKKRKPNVVRATYEIRSIVDDCRINCVGGLAAGIEIWEMAVIPVILYNSESWQGINDQTIKILENLQYNFLRSILAVGSGCPLPLLLSETGMLLMENRVLQKKVLFLHHLENLPSSALAKEIFKAQNLMGLPGIMTDCSEFLVHFELSDLKSFSKEQFKRLVKQKIKIWNKMKILEIVSRKEYKKVDTTNWSCDFFQQKPYFKSLSVSDARLRFKIESKMVLSVKMNFQK